MTQIDTRARGDNSALTDAQLARLAEQIAEDNDICPSCGRSFDYDSSLP